MQAYTFGEVTVVQEDSLDIVIYKGERELYRKRCTKKKSKQDLLDEVRYFIYMQKCKNKLRRIARREKEKK